MKELIKRILEEEYPMLEVECRKLDNRKDAVRLHKYAFELQKLVLQAQNKSESVVPELEKKEREILEKANKLI